jgi:CRP-like cAMP-binding protein
MASFIPMAGHTFAPFLFTGLNEETTMISRLPVRSCSAGEIVIAEGSVNDRIYWVESGEFAVWKGPVNDPRGVQMAALQPGECFGEMSVLQGAAASASLVALKPSALRELRLSDLPETGGIRSQVMLNLARTLVGRLTSTNENLHAKHAAEQAAHRRLLASLMMVGRILVTLSIYIFLLPVAEWLKPVLPSDSLISFGFIFLLTGMTWGFQRTSGLDRREFGLEAAQWAGQVWRGIRWTLPWLAVVLGAKWAWVLFHPGEMRVFEPMRAMNASAGPNWTLWAVFAAVYAGLSFAQEYVRAVTQGALALFYRTAGQPDRGRSLLIANLVFAILHVHLSAVIAVLAFGAGLLWGWIFQREKSYLAAAASHAVAGVWVLFVVGIPY